MILDIVLFGALTLSANAWATDAARGEIQTPEACARLAGDSSRLACYDRIFRSAPPASEFSESPSLPSTHLLNSAKPTSPEQGSREALAEFNALSRFWELGPNDKRGTFTVRTYLPNYLFPIHYSSNINRAPYSKTLPPPDQTYHYRQAETKFQISLRAKIVEDFVLPNSDVWFTYTQRTFWQFWDEKDSTPFRSTDYQPEVIYVMPIPDKLGEMPAGWKWKMAQIGVAHQSNGQSDPLSRSWNYAYGAAAFERGEFGMQLRIFHRVPESGLDDNPKITSYIGNTEMTATWLPGRATASLMWRASPGYLNRGSMQFDWTYPVDRDQPKGLRWYLQLFTGYGETLLDFNHKQTSLGLGVSLFQY